MLNDIRIVEKEDKFSICRVIYQDNGDVEYSENPYSEYDDLQDAYAFLDQMYKASIKPILLVHTDGSFES